MSKDATLKPFAHDGDNDYYRREDGRVFSILEHDSNNFEIHERYDTEEDSLPIIPNTSKRAKSIEGAITAINNA